MRYNIADILADLGFRYDRRYLNLPESDRPFSVTRIEETLLRNLRYAEPSSEAARREIAVFRKVDPNHKTGVGTGALPLRVFTFFQSTRDRGRYYCKPL